jgi:hypothetical protein
MGGSSGTPIPQAIQYGYNFQVLVEIGLPVGGRASRRPSSQADCSLFLRIISLSGLSAKHCLRNLKVLLKRSELNLSLAEAVNLED